MSSTLVGLNQEFALPNLLYFKELSSEILVAQIDSPLATATISLYGGHVIDWWPKHQKTSVLWASNPKTFAMGKAIRGGIPICWPWFGGHPTSSQHPSHGYARISPWDMVSTELMSDGAIRISLAMQSSEMSLSHFPISIRLAVQITVGEQLTVELTTTNESNREILLTEGLHTYFNVDDVSAIQVLGLEGAQYVDLVCGNVTATQEGPLRFNGEVGRVFTNSTEICEIVDPGFARRITIEKTGSLSTAVWNPWAQTAAKMDDLGSASWRNMVCVESANALSNSIRVGPSTFHVMGATYSAGAI